MILTCVYQDHSLAIFLFFIAGDYSLEKSDDSGNAGSDDYDNDVLAANSGSLG